MLLNCLKIPKKIKRIILALLKELKHCTILVKSKKIRNCFVKMPRLEEKIHEHSNGSKFRVSFEKNVLQTYTPAL